MSKKHDYALMSLRTKDAVYIMILYAFLLIISAVILFQEISTNVENIGITNHGTIITLIASSLCGSCIFYSRKLYKAAINDSYEFTNDSIMTNRRIGTLAFFLFRPIFGTIFSILTYAIWKTSLSISVENTAVTDNILYVIIPIGFFSGFSAGKLIEQFEARDIRKLTEPEDPK